MLDLCFDELTENHNIRNYTATNSLSIIYLEPIAEPTPPAVASTTCNYSGTGDWNVNYSDNCVASTTTWVKGNCNFNYNGAGSFSLRSLLQCDNINAGNGFIINAENSSARIEIY